MEEEKSRAALLQKFSYLLTDGGVKIENGANLTAKDLKSGPSVTENSSPESIKLAEVIDASSKALRIISSKKRAAVVNAEKAIVSLKEQIKTLKEDMGVLKGQIQNELAHTASLRQELQVARSEKETWRAKATELEGKVETLQSELSTSNRKLEEINSAFLVLTTEINSKLVIALEEASQVIDVEDPSFTDSFVE